MLLKHILILPRQEAVLITYLTSDNLKYIIYSKYICFYLICGALLLPIVVMGRWASW